MVSSSEEVLEAAVARIPEIARIIASLPVEDRPSAFDVAERSYLRTAKYLGGADDLAQRWASAVMYRLREHVEERVLAKSKLLTALYEELVGTPIAAGISESLNNEAAFNAGDEDSTNKPMEKPSNTPIKVEVTELYDGSGKTDAD